MCGALATATWTSVGSPFQICASGATIPGGATVTIDASAGPVVVEAQGVGGLTVYGVLQAANTTVHSVSFTSVTPTPGSWNGVWFRADTATPPNRGSGWLENVQIRYAYMALVASNGGGTNFVVGGKSYAVVMRNSSILDSSSTGVYSSGGSPVYVDSTVIRNAAPATYGVLVSATDVTLGSVTADNATWGISVSGASGKAVSITNSTVNRAAQQGIRVQNGGINAGTLILQGNTVTNSGAATTTTKYPAIELLNVKASFGAGQNVDDLNRGADNAINAIAFGGEVTNSFTWKTAAAATGAAAPLGYVLTSPFTMNGNLSLTVPGGGVVKSSSSITLNGGQLIATDATRGGAIFTSLNDGTVGVDLCGSEYFLVGFCAPAPSSWTGIVLSTDTSAVPNRASGNFDGSTIKFANMGVYAASGATSLAVGTGGYGVVMRNSRLLDNYNFGLYAAGTPVYVASTTVDRATMNGIGVAGGAGSVFSDLVMQNVAQNGLIVSNTGATISRARLTNVGGTSPSFYGIVASGGVTTIDCSTIRGNAQGVSLGTAGSWIRNSSLNGNMGTGRVDLDDAVVVGAQSNWWGQATGPVPGQIRVPANADTTGFVTGGAPSVTIALSASSTAVNGAFGIGTMTVTLTFDRDMDASVQPTVTFNPGAHVVTGTWQSNKRTWVGTYALSSATATAGPNTLTVIAANACASDSTAVVGATTKTFTADFSKAAVTTDPATAVTSTSATLAGTATPSGWATSGFLRYGTATGTYGLSTPSQALGTGTLPISFTAPLTALTPSTTYYFVAVAATANGEAVGAERSFTTATAPASTLLVTAPSSATAGTSFTVTVTAKDALNNTVTSYAGTVRFSSSDAAAVLPANVTFATTDNGTRTVSLTLTTAGTQTITATDTVTAVTGSASVNVAPGAATDRHFVIRGPLDVQRGHPFTIRVVAVDAAGKRILDHAGSVRFTSSDAAATLPAPYTFTAGDQGAHRFTVKLDTLGVRTITVTDTGDASITGSKTVTVKAEDVDDQLNNDDGADENDRAAQAHQLRHERRLDQERQRETTDNR